MTILDKTEINRDKLSYFSVVNRICLSLLLITKYGGRPWHDRVKTEMHKKYPLSR